MKNVIIGAVVIGGGIAAIVWYSKYKKKNFDKKCKANGGSILESGRICSI